MLRLVDTGDKDSMHSMYVRILSIVVYIHAVTYLASARYGERGYVLKINVECVFWALPSSPLRSAPFPCSPPSEVRRSKDRRSISP